MRKVAVVGLTVLLASCSTQQIKPEHAASLSTQELCIDNAAVTLYGTGVRFGGQLLDGAVISAELQKRGETCQPTDSYEMLARTRMLEQKKAEGEEAKKHAVLLQQSGERTPGMTCNGGEPSVRCVRGN